MVLVRNCTRQHSAECCWPDKRVRLAYNTTASTVRTTATGQNRYHKYDEQIAKHSDRFFKLLASPVITATSLTYHLQLRGDVRLTALDVCHNGLLLTYHEANINLDKPSHQESLIIHVVHMWTTLLPHVLRLTIFTKAMCVSHTRSRESR